MYSFSHFFLLQTFSCSPSFKLCSASPFSSFPLPISPSSTSHLPLFHLPSPPLPLPQTLPPTRHPFHSPIIPRLSFSSFFSSSSSFSSFLTPSSLPSISLSFSPPLLFFHLLHFPNFCPFHVKLIKLINRFIFFFSSR